MKLWRVTQLNRTDGETEVGMNRDTTNHEICLWILFASTCAIKPHIVHELKLHRLSQQHRVSQKWYRLILLIFLTINILVVVGIGTALQMALPQSHWKSIHYFAKASWMSPFFLKGELSPGTCFELLVVRCSYSHTWHQLYCVWTHDPEDILPPNAYKYRKQTGDSLCDASKYYVSTGRLNNFSIT